MLKKIKHKKLVYSFFSLKKLKKLKISQYFKQLLITYKKM